MNETLDPIISAARRFLRQPHVAVLATVDEQGLPYAVNLYVVTDEQMRFYFISNPASAHCRQLQHQPHVHLAASAPHNDWQKAHGYQVKGTCEPVSHAHYQHALSLYRRHFPCLEEISQKAHEAIFYCTTPERLRWIDNRIRFGFKVDLPWPIPNSLPAPASGGA